MKGKVFVRPSHPYIKKYNTITYFRMGIRIQVAMFFISEKVGEFSVVY